MTNNVGVSSALIVKSSAKRIPQLFTIHYSLFTFHNPPNGMGIKIIPSPEHKSGVGYKVFHGSTLVAAFHCHSLTLLRAHPSCHFRQAAPKWYHAVGSRSLLTNRLFSELPAKARMSSSQLSSANLPHFPGKVNPKIHPLRARRAHGMPCRPIDSIFARPKARAAKYGTREVKPPCGCSGVIGTGGARLSPAILFWGMANGYPRTGFSPFLSIP